jgi:hypothetical protein
MNKPTIGRIVNYKPTEGDVVPAIITYVGEPEKEDSWVNLRVFRNSSENPPFCTSVQKNKQTVGQSDYTWEWPMR